MSDQLFLRLTTKGGLVMMHAERIFRPDVRLKLLIMFGAFAHRK